MPDHTTDNTDPQLTSSVTPGGVTEIVTNDEPLDVASLLGDASMPEIDESAINRAREKSQQKAEKQAQFADLVDAKGHSFNPDMHITDTNGEPVLTSKGKLRRKPGGAAVKAEGGQPKQSKSHINIGGGTAAQAAGTYASVAAGPARSFDPKEIEEAAHQMAGMYWTGMVLFFGESGIPDKKKGEPDQQYLALKETFERVGVIRMPWWAGLAVAMATPVVVRLADPDVRKSISDGEAGLASKIAGLMKKRKEAKKKAETNGK